MVPGDQVYRELFFCIVHGKLLEQVGKLLKKERSSIVLENEAYFKKNSGKPVYSTQKSHALR